MKKSTLYLMLGAVLITSTYLIPFDVLPVATYRGYDIMYDVGETHMYLISGLTGQYSTVATAEAAIDGYLGAPPAVNQAPHAEAGGPYAGKVGETINLYSIGSYDPDGDSLTYYWRMGDGYTSMASNPQHSYAAPGSYTVKLYVQDPSELESKDTATVTIVAVSDPLPQPAANKPPVAKAGGPYTGVTGVAVSFSAAKSYDEDGSIVGYQWAFGDGGVDVGGVVTHVYSGEEGEYTVDLTVTDNDGATAQTQATVFIVTPTTPRFPVDEEAPEPSFTTLAVWGLGTGCVLVGLVMRRRDHE